MLIHNKDDIEFVTEFPCLLGHPVVYIYTLLVRFYPINVKTAEPIGPKFCVKPHMTPKLEE